MSDYGEPWAIIEGHVANSDGEWFAILSEGAVLKMRRRSVACVNALAGIDDPAAWVAKAREFMDRHICLVCGATEPCMTEADLKPGDPGVPCTFDPTPAELHAAIDALRQERDALRAEVERLQGVFNGSIGSTVVGPVTVTACYSIDVSGGER